MLWMLDALRKEKPMTWGKVKKTKADRLYEEYRELSAKSVAIWERLLWQEKLSSVEADSNREYLDAIEAETAAYMAYADEDEKKLNHTA
jgi:hypothetical protein